METISLLEKQLKNINEYGFHRILSTVEELQIQTLEDFTGSELDALLKKLLSNDHYELFLKFLQIVRKLPYSQSYYRRSYRAPNSFKLHSYRITQLIIALLENTTIQFFEAFEHDGKKRYVQHGAHPMYSKDLAQGIMMSNHEEMQKLLGDVLLAAKNQEGARQVITETMDEGTLEAQIYFMELLIEHDLTRFSSVVRAVDVWFGLGYEAKDRKQIQYVLEAGLKGLQDEAYTEQLLTSRSNLDVYIGLWVMSCRVVATFLARIDEFMQKEDYIQQTVLYALHNVVWVAGWHSTKIDMGASSMVKFDIG